MSFVCPAAIIAAVRPVALIKLRRPIGKGVHDEPLQQLLLAFIIISEQHPISLRPAWQGYALTSRRLDSQVFSRYKINFWFRLRRVGF
jgi:hypothetical protein